MRMQITAGQVSSDAQRAWLDRIRTHMVENLSIDIKDSEPIPLGTHIEKALCDINEAIAA